jgi:hypothetical protein
MVALVLASKKIILIAVKKKYLLNNNYLILPRCPFPCLEAIFTKHRLLGLVVDQPIEGF